MHIVFVDCLANQYICSNSGRQPTKDCSLFHVCLDQFSSTQKNKKDHRPVRKAHLLTRPSLSRQSLVLRISRTGVLFFYLATCLAAVIGNDLLNRSRFKSGQNFTHRFSHPFVTSFSNETCNQSRKRFDLVLI